ncbi:MAG: CAP domain-containing protein [Myxococcaceae bacterium]|nr:MAG: CAP domain-containing protein [Myxococcaceae bacterium]
MIIPRTLILSASLALCPLLASAQTIDHPSVAPMVTAINAERARFSLPPLAEDPRLDALAEAHSMDMVRSRFFSHESPSTGRPSDRVSQSGLRWTTVAENIAINQSPEAAQQALLRSPGHHENMVDPAQRSVGVGIVRHGEQVWVTQLFATLNDAPGAATPTPAQIAAHPVAPVAPVAPAAPVAEDDEEDSDEDADEEQECDAPVAPAAPVAPVAPVTPTAPSLPGFSGLPMQGIPGLEQFLTGLGLTRQPTPPSAGRAAPAPQVYTVQTPFGPVRVEVPSSLASPTVAEPAVAAPTRHRSARPAPAPRAPHRRTTPPSRGRVVQVDTLDV